MALVGGPRKGSSAETDTGDVEISGVRVEGGGTVVVIASGGERALAAIEVGTLSHCSII